jgi:L-iditol 2-dehydrogenase
MISQRYPLERANEAFEDMKRGKDKDGNTVIKPFVGNWDLK